MMKKRSRKAIVPILVLSFVVGLVTVPLGETAAATREIAVDAISTATVTQSQDTQVITTGKASYLVAYGSGVFSLDAMTDGDGDLSYRSIDTKVATVSDSGNVSLVGCGKTIITIKASETDQYYAASKSVLVRVKPKKMTLTSVVSTLTKTVTVNWPKDSKVVGYEIVIAKNSSFTLGKSTILVPSVSTVSRKILGLTKGVRYYAKIRSYTLIGTVKLYGDYSTAKNVVSK